MKNIFLSLFMMIFSSTVLAKETWVVKKMPGVKFLHRTYTGKYDYAKVTAVENELFAEAKQLDLVHSKTIFLKTDIKKKMVVQAGLEVTGTNLSKAPEKYIMTRKAGKYLIGYYTGPETRKLQESIIPTLREKKLLLKEETAYSYLKNPGTAEASLILMLPVK